MRKFEPFVIPVKKKTIIVNAFLQENTRLYELHVPHTGEENGIDENIVFKSRIETFADFYQLFQVKNLPLVLLKSRKKYQFFMIVAMRHFFNYQTFI